MPSLIRNVSSAEIDGIDLANAVMDLLLRSVVNETTCEFGRINEFDTSYFAVLINLAGTILKIVPMKDMGWKNDGQGDRPKEFDEWVKELAEGLLKLIKALIAAIGDFIAGLVEAAVEAGLKFAEIIAKAVMALIEAIVKAAILALVYLLFAFMVFGLVIAISSMALIFLPILAISGGRIIYEAKSTKINIFNKSLEIGFETPTNYYSYLDAEIPYILFFCNIDENKVFTQTLSILPFDMTIEDPPLSNNNGNSDSELFFIFSPIHKLYFLDILTGVVAIEIVPFMFSLNDEDIDFKYTLTKIENGEEIATEYTDVVWSEENIIIIGEEGFYKLKLWLIKNGQIIGSREVTFGVVDLLDVIDGFALAMDLMGKVLTFLNVFILLKMTAKEELLKVSFLGGVYFLIREIMELFAEDSISSWWGVLLGLFINFIAFVSLIIYFQFFMASMGWETFAGRLILFEKILYITEPIATLIEGLLYFHEKVFPIFPSEEIAFIFKKIASSLEIFNWFLNFWQLSVGLHRPGNWQRGRVLLVVVTMGVLALLILTIVRFYGKDWPIF
ncbi:MAG: hypothetical protein ACTSPD_21540 [Promethearchaeota archaeon]